MPDETTEQLIARRVSGADVTLAADVIARVNSILLGEEFGLNEKWLTPDAVLTLDLQLDSLDDAALELSLEDEFGIEIPDYEILDIHTLSDLYLYVAVKLVPENSAE